MIVVTSPLFSFLPLDRDLTRVAPLISSSALSYRHPGALATLFGFYVAASSPLPLPVTVVSVASPRVGNLGHLRHLRVVNDRDPVTMSPTVSFKRALALSAKAVSPLGYLALLLTGNHEGGGEEVY